MFEKLKSVKEQLVYTCITPYKIKNAVITKVYLAVLYLFDFCNKAIKTRMELAPLFYLNTYSYIYSLFFDSLRAFPLHSVLMDV